MKLGSTRQLLLGITNHLSVRRKFQLLGLLLVALAAALTELLALGSVLPFLAVLSEPEVISQWPWIQQFVLMTGWSSPSQLLVAAAGFFAAAAVLAGAVRSITLWSGGRLSAAIGSDLSSEVYRRTLFQPYSVHVNRNSSVVINAVINQSNRSVGAIHSALTMLTAGFIVVSLLVGFFLIDWSVALSAALLFGIAYFVIATFSRRELARNSQEITFAGARTLKALQEGLGAIRDVLLDGTQTLYLEVYKSADRPQRKLRARNDFLIAFPRFALEALGLLAIAFLAVTLVLSKGSGSAAIPFLGAFAMGAQRLLPAMQQVYGGWSALKGSTADLCGVLQMLEQPLPQCHQALKPLSLKNGIELQDISFAYGEESPLIIKQLSLNIEVGQRIGLIGATGSGKSTAADLLMGLLEPSRGSILLDGLELHDPSRPDRLLSWRSAIAHVPQSIYLADSSVAENIAFGFPKDQIDYERVRMAAQRAQIAGFVETLPGAYGSFVGERGIQLSGGQRQRLGIARALYKHSQVLILDEATSALDHETELAVMSAIDSLDYKPTIVMIAHRLTTVAKCDRVIRLDSGVVVADGPPSEVLSQ